MHKRFYRRFPGRNHSRNGQSTFEIVNAIRAMQSAAPSVHPANETYQTKNTFDSFPISQKLKSNISYKRYTKPTPIQDQVIPLILNGNDIIGIANTGTGKTAAFLVPLIEKISNNPNEFVLIITPTRELADQISDELYGFTYEMNIRWALCIGGANIEKQKSNLSKHPNFVIGTPGRLKDLVQRGNLKLNMFTAVVLDEADRMVDMGFINDIKFFISGLSGNRQSLFFSATIPPKVSEILKSFVRNPVTVSVKTRDAIENITQDLINLNPNEKKLEKLDNLLKQKEFEKVLIFGRTKWGIQRLSNELVKRGFNAAAIHGNKNQGQRQKILDDFKSNKISILLATDIASRGLDIQNISHVINYDLPASYEDYIHRIGRTGRADRKGTALTFLESM